MKILQRLRTVIRGFMIRRSLHCPRCADYPEQIRDMESVMNCLRVKRDEALGGLEQTTRAYAGLVEDNNALRSQLMQLRVTPGSQRKGFAVAAFIPEDVLREMKTRSPEAINRFVDTIARVLVYRAVNGLLHIEPSGEVTSIVFVPVSTHPKNHRRIATCFGDGHKISYPLGAELLPGADKTAARLELEDKKHREEFERLQLLAQPSSEFPVEGGQRVVKYQDELADGPTKEEWEELSKRVSACDGGWKCGFCGYRGRENVASKIFCASCKCNR